jgi:acetyltransferase-like isoleucine patch superfamily enzyme
MCHIGLAHLEHDVLVGAGVHIPSGAETHGIDDIDVPIREQPGRRQLVTIGAGSWIGSAAIVMADVGANSVVAAGSVVTKPVEAAVVAAGVPARVVRSRT